MDESDSDADTLREVLEEEPYLPASAVTANAINPFQKGAEDKWTNHTFRGASGKLITVPVFWTTKPLTNWPSTTQSLSKK